MLDHAKAEQAVLRLMGTIAPNAKWQLLETIKSVGVEMEKNNWQPCIYGMRPSKIGDREEVIDPNYKVPSPFVKVTKTKDWPKKPTWASVIWKTFWMVSKSFLMAYGAYWAIYYIIRTVG